MLDINDLKRIGTIIKLEGQPYQVIFSQHARTAQRKAFVRTKLKNLLSGAVLERTFSSGEKIEEAEVDKIPATFAYRQADNFYFIDQKSWEQIFLSLEQLFGKELFLREGLEVHILFFEERPIALELPKKVVLKVIEAPPGIRGDRVSAGEKPVILETGLKVNTPLFIKVGDNVLVNTETGEYVERAEKMSNF